MEYGENRPITDDEIAAFSERLARWADELPPQEKALARLLLARAQQARLADPGDFSYRGSDTWVELVNAVFGDIVTRRPDVTSTPDGGAPFAKDPGPSWVKGAWTDSAELAARAAPIDNAVTAAAARSSVARFGNTLGAYADGLPAREQRLLTVVLLRAMDSLERIRWTSDPDLLDPGSRRSSTS